ncbi:MAG: hypothetical protein ACTS22_10390 [Phycisphaerales bacterium]
MKRVARVAWMMATVNAAAATLGLSLLGFLLHPATEGMTNTRIEAERWLLLDAARGLPWWLGWVPAMRHEAISTEWYLRHPGLTGQHGVAVGQELQLAQPPKHLNDNLGDSSGI